MLVLATPQSRAALSLGQAWQRAAGSTRVAADYAIKRAKLDITQCAHHANVGIAALFTWEHTRAFQYERALVHSYWDDPRIHNFGNVGWRGLLHAVVVPVATHAIDRFAYSGVDVRKVIHETIIPQDANVVDLCCGVGFSASSLEWKERLAHLTGRIEASRSVTGVDTSDEMLAIARIRRPEVRFTRGNAEDWGASGCCDVATVMYGMHEMPRGARRRVIRNALRLARQSVLVVDICPDFEPSPMMLSGEPFVLDYLANIDDDVAAVYNTEDWTLQRVNLVDDHVTMWKFDRIQSV